MDETFNTAHAQLEQVGIRYRALEKIRITAETEQLKSDLEVLLGDDWFDEVVPRAAKRGGFDRREIENMRDRRIDELRVLLDRIDLYNRADDLLKIKMDGEATDRLKRNRKGSRSSHSPPHERLPKIIIKRKVLSSVSRPRVKVNPEFNFNGSPYSS